MVETHIEVLEAGTWKYHRVDWLPGSGSPSEALEAAFATLGATGGRHIVKCSRGARLAMDDEWSKRPSQILPFDPAVDDDLRPSLGGVIIEWTNDLPRTDP